MSAAEQLEDVKTAPPRRDALLEEEAFIEAQLTQSPAKTSAKLRPLLALAPYVGRYRGRAALAFVSLTVAAITTLVVPVAVRRSPRKAAPSNAANTTLVSRSADTAPIALPCIAQIMTP